MTRTHIERLGEFREILVATRREGIRNHTRDAMRASGFQIGDSEGSSYGAQLKALQEEIEAVDRATLATVRERGRIFVRLSVSWSR
jgi:hypothetical protein